MGDVFRQQERWEARHQKTSELGRRELWGGGVHARGWRVSFRNALSRDAGRMETTPERENALFLLAGRKERRCDQLREGLCMGVPCGASVVRAGLGDAGAEMDSNGDGPLVV